MRKILFCFLAFLLVMMIAVIASVGFSQLSEPTMPYSVWLSETDVQMAAGIAAVSLLPVIVVVSSRALCSMFYNNIKCGSSYVGITIQTLSWTNLKSHLRHGRHISTAFSWRTPLIKPMLT